MKFSDKRTDWGFIANSFVFSKKFKRQNRRVHVFIKTMHRAKI